ncbi:DUF1285 domain-containing protein [Aestuariivita boseongensis]|uniref:DUF1285 domain-containing protein n=1 Tax=Aestuariivita boseongensis TaxID=1470562 RepID=UPI0006820C8D|nr:DUF1285 domain-containing protein [Aestuariivita boseongensis]
MSGQKAVTPSADGLAASVKAAKPRGRPPVHLWNPPFSGDLDIRIARDGTWYYEGSRFERLELVKLFSSILKKEGDKYFLVTPVEKVGIIVEDAPFVAVDFDVEGDGEGQTLTFLTQVGETAKAGADLPIRVAHDDETGEPAPYVLIRDNLEALIDRKSFYRLVELGTHKDGWFGVWSQGTFFPIAPSDTVEEG